MLYLQCFLSFATWRYKLAKTDRTWLGSLNIIKDSNYYFFILPSPLIPGRSDNETSVGLGFFLYIYIQSTQEKGTVSLAQAEVHREVHCFTEGWTHPLQTIISCSPALSQFQVHFNTGPIRTPKMIALNSSSSIQSLLLRFGAQQFKGDN